MCMRIKTGNRHCWLPAFHIYYDSSNHFLTIITLNNHSLMYIAVINWSNFAVFEF